MKKLLAVVLFLVIALAPSTKMEAQKTTGNGCPAGLKAYPALTKKDDLFGYVTLCPSPAISNGICCTL